ncbi:hypothetical protein UlMin_014890 [Ulmus minor]
MEDEAQKMVALKKAYAEIILNTAKEAAARILVSERKAFRFQQDLSASKEEALRMLVRMKQMIDSKTTEAELTASSQQKRIEELELQLEEAEGVITDLRGELNRMGDELEKEKNNQVKSLNGCIAKEDASFSRNLAPLSGSRSESMVTSVGINNLPLNQRDLDDMCCGSLKQTERLSVSDLDNFDSKKSDFASIIMRNKKPELYRNGCTQRIRALERNLLDGKLPISEYTENEFAIKESDTEVALSLFCLKHDKMEKDKKLSQGEMKKPVKVRTLRRRKTHFGKAKTSRKYKRNPVNGNGRSKEGLCTLPSTEATNMDLTETSDVLRETLQHESGKKQLEIPRIFKGKRNRKIKSVSSIDASSTCPPGKPTKPCQPSSFLTRCRTFAYLVNGGIKSGENHSSTSENETVMKPLPQSDPGLRLIKSDVISALGSTSVTENLKGVNKSGNIQNAAEEDIVLIEESKSLKQESEAVEDSRFSSSVLKSETTKVSSMSCGLNAKKASEQSHESASKLDDNRPLKYTFQRKRKREATFSPADITSPEKSCARRKTAEIEDMAPEPQKSNSMDESSRESRRLAQVARQLISMSGRRW